MSHIGNWEWDLITNKIYLSEELYRIFRCDSRELATSYNEYLSYVTPKIETMWLMPLRRL